MAANRIILVTNLSPNCEDKTLRDFFSFCGEVEDITFKEDGDTRVATVTFVSAAAPNTALLLSNAMILNRPIRVALPGDAPVAATPTTEEGGGGAFGQAAATALTAAAPAPAAAAAADGGGDGAAEFADQGEALAYLEGVDSAVAAVPQEKKSKARVVSELIAAGYVVTEDSLASARRFDADHLDLGRKVSTGAAVARDAALASASAVQRAGRTVQSAAVSVDANLGVYNAAASTAAALDSKLKAIDASLHLSETARSTFEAVTNSSAMQAGADALNSFFGTMSATSAEVNRATKEEIAAIRMERAKAGDAEYEQQMDSLLLDNSHHGPAGSPPPSAAPMAPPVSTGPPPSPPPPAFQPPQPHPSAQPPPFQTQPPAPLPPHDPPSQPPAGEGV